MGLSGFRGVAMIELVRRECNVAWKMYLCGTRNDTAENFS